MARSVGSFKSLHFLFSLVLFLQTNCAYSETNHDTNSNCIKYNKRVGSERRVILSENNTFLKIVNDEGKYSAKIRQNAAFNSFDVTSTSVPRDGFSLIETSIQVRNGSYINASVIVKDQDHWAVALPGEYIALHSKKAGLICMKYESVENNTLLRLVKYAYEMSTGVSAGNIKNISSNQLKVATPSAFMAQLGL
ncbi:MAG: hypothetical protein H6619_01030 [Deltaproteobacteria bacterium]|nr:hypothetical protein [Deltaproteobacteria bacterium]